MASLLAPSRRDLLKGTGALVVAFSLPGAPAALADAAAKTKTVAPDEVDAFLAIDTRGAVTLYSGKVDLGTGVRTAMTQIVADELDVPMSAITVIEGDTALTPDQGTSSGSLSIQNGGMQIRLAAAAARRQLLKEAAKHLGSDDLSVADGLVTAHPSGRSVTYAQLVGGKDFALKLDKDVPLKSPKSWRFIGASAPRLDIPDKVTARFTYAQDFRLPDMLHARVVRPPAIGATLESVDDGSVAGMPDVAVVREGNFLAVVAPTEWNAIKAMHRLKATWTKWEGLPEQSKLWEYIRATKIVKDEVTSNVGDAGAALANGTKRLKATYEFPIHTHGSIGPSCAVAEMKDGQLTCWTPSQATHNLRKQIAAMMGMNVADVRCIYVDGSGCYGRNGHEDAAADAALLARKLGKPVRVQWMREDEHGWDPKGPPTLIDMEGALDDKGGVAAWSGDFFIADGAPGTVPLVAASLAGLPRETYNAPGNIQHNSAVQYTFPNKRTVCHRLAETPFRPSWIRTPGRMQNTFANESFLDELAAAANADPLEYRRRYLDDGRALELLERLARLAKWETRPSPQRQQAGDIVTGRGASYVKYELLRTYIGAVAEVEVHRESGTIKVTRFFVVHDCGQIVNPDGVANQIEGNIVQTVSRTLKEELKFDRSAVTSLDWATYPILTFPEVPEIIIELVDRPNEKPWGAGEPSASIVPSAISNAVFDATGARLRSVPFTKGKVRAALQGA